MALPTTPPPLVAATDLGLAPRDPQHYQRAGLLQFGAPPPLNASSISPPTILPTTPAIGPKPGIKLAMLPIVEPQPLPVFRLLNTLYAAMA